MTGESLYDSALFGNPSSGHREGRDAHSALEESRRVCAGALGAEAGTIYFTSGATEANAIPLFSMLYGHAGGVRQGLITSAAEHPSITKNCAQLERLGIPVHYMDIDGYGGAVPAALEKALRKHSDATMLALMHVNNETGAISDLNALAEKTRRRDGKALHIHSDMVQALGKLPFALRDIDIDSASFSAHKIGGPRGIGILYLRKPVEVLYKGGGQEWGIRPGTENIAGACLFAEALRSRAARQTKDYGEAVEKMTYLIESLRSIKRCTIIPECREAVDSRYSPYILQAAFRDIPGEVMARALDDEGFAVSTGSACSTGSKKRPGLKLIGIDDRVAFTAIRISFGWTTQVEDITALIDAVRRILSKL
jgi:cysteine desulfurase